MPLNPKEKQHLKARAHALKPVILLGANGVTEAVIKEVDRALTDHELIKIKVPAQDRDERKALMAAICEQTQAELVQSIGMIGVFFRKAEK